MSTAPGEGTPFERAWYRWRHQVILRARETPAPLRARVDALDRDYLALQHAVYEVADTFRAGQARDYAALTVRLRADLEMLRAKETGLPDEVRVGYILFGEATEALLAVIDGRELDAGAV